jgi:putative ABC transport system substrate-binding protein
MQRGKLIARLAATVPAGFAKLGRARCNLSPLERCTRALRVLAVIAIGMASFAHEAATQEPVHRIAIVQSSTGKVAEQFYSDALRAKGYEVGRNLQIDYRYTDQLDRIPALVAELVAIRPEIIVVAGSDHAVAVHAAAPTIPLVFFSVADPVFLGLVPNLAHPGGNVTGTMTIVPEGFADKLLELLKSATPDASRIAILFNPKNRLNNPDQLADPARRLGVELVMVRASKVEELDAAFQEARSRGAEAIFIFGDPVTFGASAKIANLALQYRWPSIYFFRKNALDGGLMSYGSNGGEMGRALARQIDKILKGAKPGDLPVEQPTQFDLVINLKTAKALGITIPTTLLVQATEVIE